LIDELLARGWQLRATVRSKSSNALEPRGQLQIETVNLLDSQQLTPLFADVDVVFHLAGVTAALRPGDFEPVNVGGVEAIAQAASIQAKPPTLVMVSSVAAAGPAARDGVRTEAEAAAPVSAYCRSKLAGEQVLLRFADRVPATIIRPGVVFGPRDKASLRIFRAIRRSGVHVYPRLRTPPLSVIYVQDVVRLLISAAERGERLPPPGANGDAVAGQGIYFACREEFPTYHEFGRLAATALDRRWFIPLPLPPPVPLLVGGASEMIARLRGKASILNRDKIIEATVPSWACSPAKSREQLAWSADQPLLDQMRQTVAWYRQAGWL
jgi:nucleoside-diphosphate-sugar epimerase